MRLNREPHMKHHRLATIVSLARTMAKQDLRLAAEYLRGQGLPLGLARHVLRKEMRRAA
jgi:hypothetical protein